MNVRLASLLVLLASLSACRRGDPVVRIGTSSLTPLHAALGEILARTDILAQHDLRGSFLSFERGKDQHESCVQGVVDATFSCEVAAMVHLERLPGTALTGSPGALGNMALVVPESSSAKEVADLDGAVIVVLAGASSELALEGWLEEAGVRARVRTAGADDASAALASRRAQAAVLWDPWLSQAHGLLDLRVLAEAPFWSVVMTYEGHHDAGTWIRYHRALEDALEWAHEHPDETVAWAAERGPLDAEVVRTVLETNDYVAGRAPATLEVAPAVQARLEQCATWAQERRQVGGGFRLAERQRPTP